MSLPIFLTVQSRLLKIIVVLFIIDRLKDLDLSPLHSLASNNAMSHTCLINYNCTEGVLHPSLAF